MYVAFMPLHVFFCIDVLSYIYIVLEVDRHLNLIQMNLHSI
jgi:hypothetical protein